MTVLAAQGPARTSNGQQRFPTLAIQHYIWSVTLKSHPPNEEVIHCLLTLVRRGSPGAVKARWYARCNG